MPDWSWIGSLLDFCAAYYTTQLVRCAAFSFVLIGLVMLLRKVFFSRRTFIRGLLWSSFLLIPFLGKLKLFYENKAVVVITGRITHGTMTCLWADYIYMAGILIAAVCIFGKRLRLRKSVAGMEKVSLDNMQVRITDMNVTPFTVGLFAPKIVIPKVMLESYSREELRSVIQHERTHIRLGHLNGHRPTSRLALTALISASWVFSFFRSAFMTSSSIVPFAMIWWIMTVSFCPCRWSLAFVC